VLLGGSLVKGVQSQGVQNGGIAGSAGKQRQALGVHKLTATVGKAKKTMGDQGLDASPADVPFGLSRGMG
jgi:hypothetical protein